MSYAKVAALSINLQARHIFNDVGRASTLANGSIIDAFDHKGHGSHKYIDADRWTEDLGMEQGAGVYGFWIMKDGSYLLLTCKGRLAYADAYAGRAYWPTDDSPGKAN